MTKLMLTVLEASEATGLGRTTIYELIRAGEIPSVSIGKSRRIPSKGLEAWVEARLGASAQTSTQGQPKPDSSHAA